MKRIVSVIRPFVLQQNIIVYEDGNKIDAISATLDEIVDKLVEVSAQYQAKEIQLIGAKKFSKGIQEKIEKAEMAKYGKNELVINLISN